MKSIYYKSKWSQSTPTNFHQIFNLIERVGLALLICWISAGAAAQAVNQPTNFLLAQREKENLVCGCCPCRRPEAVGAPFHSFSCMPGELHSRISFFHSTHPLLCFIPSILFELGWLLLSLLSWAEPLAVPPPITHPINQHNQPTIRSARLHFLLFSFNQINSWIWFDEEKEGKLGGLAQWPSLLFFFNHNSHSQRELWNEKKEVSGRAPCRQHSRCFVHSIHQLLSLNFSNFFIPWTCNSYTDVKLLL